MDDCVVGRFYLQKIYIYTYKNNLVTLKPCGLNNKRDEMLSAIHNMCFIQLHWYTLDGV